MCGKDTITMDDVFVVWGSPPHVRERHQEPYWSSDTYRITPACAGKTSVDQDNCNVSWDHPRMCGKDPPVNRLFQCRIGSPPHVRERQKYPLKVSDLIRITPACAGKTVMAPFIFALLRLPTFKIYLISLLNI